MPAVRAATQATVYIVDDDPAVRDAMRWLLEQVKLKTRVCSSAADFLALYTPGERACLVLDVRMPDMSGLERTGAARTPQCGRRAPTHYYHHRTRRCAACGEGDEGRRR